MRYIVQFLMKVRWTSRDDEGTQRSRCQWKDLGDGLYGLSLLGFINGWQPCGYVLVVKMPAEVLGCPQVPPNDGWGLQLLKRWW